MSKVCTRCHVDKPLMDFSFNRGMSDGRHSICRACNAAGYKPPEPAMPEDPNMTATSDDDFKLPAYVDAMLDDEKRDLLTVVDKLSRAKIPRSVLEESEDRRQQTLANQAAFALSEQEARERQRATDDPRLFALRAALARLRVHLDQAVTDVDAAIAAWDGLDDTRINDEASHA